MNEKWVKISIDNRYSVSNLGKIYSSISKKILKTQSRNGYESCSIAGNRQNVHRLVAKAFIANPNNLPNINHKNGNKYDNRVENLEWITAKDNIKHAWDTGLAKSKVGENKHTSVLDNMHILTIATLHNKYDKNKLAKYLPSRDGKTPSLKSKTEQLRRIIKGERWKHLNKLFN